MLQSTLARFDFARTVDTFRRIGGDDIADIVSRVYGGQRQSVSTQQWARCWKLFGPWVVGDDERARTIVNAELNAPGLALMRTFDVVDQLARIDCPTLVCVGELDPITPVSAARELFEALPAAHARLEVIEGAGHFTWMDAPDRYWPLLLEFVAGARRT